MERDLHNFLPLTSLEELQLVLDRVTQNEEDFTSCYSQQKHQGHSPNNYYNISTSYPESIPDSDIFFGTPDTWNIQDAGCNQAQFQDGSVYHFHSQPYPMYKRPTSFSESNQSPIDFSSTLSSSIVSEDSVNEPQSPESYGSNSPRSLSSDPTSRLTPTQFPFTPEVWFDQSQRTSLQDGKCQVCGEVAGRHCAYGGRVCPSCRAFFRRSVQTKYYEIFSCNKGEKCLINLTTRKGCKFCRFKKCLQAKMQISWVLSENERDRRFNKLKKISFRNNLTSSREVKEEPVTVPVATTPPTALLFATPEIQFTVEEQIQLIC